MNVGFIGLGLMGASMALNLRKAGYAVTVSDLRRDAAAPHLAAGCTWADDAKQTAEASDVVFTSLPGPKEVEAVALAPNGLLAGMKKGMAYFDLSTNSPTVVRRLHGLFAKEGRALLDAPVSGGPSGAKSGKLALWIGGDRAVFDAHKKVLDAIGDQVAYIGPIGAGSVAKLVHNMAGYAVQTALAEVFTLGVKAGVDPLPLWAAVRQGAIGRARTFDRLGDQFLQGKFDVPAFALKLAHKDVTLATELAREIGVPMRLAALVHAEMTEGMNRGWANWDSRSPMQLQTERAGVKIAAPAEEIKKVLDNG